MSDSSELKSEDEHEYELITVEGAISIATSNDPDELIEMWETRDLNLWSGYHAIVQNRDLEVLYDSEELEGSEDEQW